MRSALAAICLSVAAAAHGSVAGESRFAPGPRSPWLVVASPARATAMGGSGAALSGGSGEQEFNPASIAGDRTLRAEATRIELGEGISLTGMTAAFGAGSGVLAMKAVLVDTGDILLRDETGTPGETVSQIGGAIAIGYALPEVLRLGRVRVGAGIVGEAVREEDTGTVVDGSIGLSLDPQSGWRFGLAARRLGPGDANGQLPGGIRMGAGRTVGPALIAVDAEYRMVEHQWMACAGVEYGIAEVVRLRAGYARAAGLAAGSALAGASAGLGLTFLPISIDYAYQPGDAFVSVHRVSLLWAPRARIAASKTTEEPPADSGESGAGSPSPADESYQAALNAYQAGDVATAYRKSYAALVTDAGHWMAWQLFGNCQDARGDRKGALVSWKKSLELHPDNPGLRKYVEDMNSGAGAGDEPR